MTHMPLRSLLSSCLAISSKLKQSHQKGQGRLMRLRNDTNFMSGKAKTYKIHERPSLRIWKQQTTARGGGSKLESCLGEIPGPAIVAESSQVTAFVSHHLCWGGPFGVTGTFEPSHAPVGNPYCYK